MWPCPCEATWFAPSRSAGKSVTPQAMRSAGKTSAMASTLPSPFWSVSTEQPVLSRWATERIAAALCMPLVNSMSRSTGPETASARAALTRATWRPTSSSSTMPSAAMSARRAGSTSTTVTAFPANASRAANRQPIAPAPTMTTFCIGPVSPLTCVRIRTRVCGAWRSGQAASGKSSTKRRAASGSSPARRRWSKKRRSVASSGTSSRRIVPLATWGSSKGSGSQHSSVLRAETANHGFDRSGFYRDVGQRLALCADQSLERLARGECGTGHDPILGQHGCKAGC